jgi:gliding motility-associated-like protein
MNINFFSRIIFLFSLLTLVNFTNDLNAQCEVSIVPNSSVVIDHDPGVSFAFQIQNNSDTPYMGGTLYLNWSLSISPIWDFNFNFNPILPNQTRYVSTPSFDIPLPENVPGNWDWYAGWTGNNYFPPGWSLFLDDEPNYDFNGDGSITGDEYCWDYVLDSTQPNGFFNNPISDGCYNPDTDIFCDDQCVIELVDFNLETSELTIIPYSTYCLNLNAPAWSNQYPYDDPYIYGFNLHFNLGSNGIDVSIGGQQIYESNDTLVIELSNNLLDQILGNILEDVENGEYCNLVLTIYNLNNTGELMYEVPESQTIELINLCPQEVVGCTDPDANNFNPLATVDDGSCLYDIYGCTDLEANNYNSEANIDDGTCEYDIFGCTDPEANNYNSEANVDDGSCSYDVYGCTDPTANNYNSDATIDDGSCTYDVYGCTDELANNFNETATVDDGSCEYNVFGCTDSNADNYNQDANIDDGSCVYSVTCDDLNSGIYVPNIFTPNNDGFNDTWEIVLNPDCWVDVKVQIFNRWGQLIWESYDSYNLLWNGSNNGSNYYVSDGIYYWYFRGRKYNSSYVEELNGYISILR